MSDQGRAVVLVVLVALSSLVMPVAATTPDDATFGGEVSISSTAQNGTTHQYELSNLSAASGGEAVFTGTRNTEWDNETATRLANGDVLPIEAAGDGPPLDQSITLTGEATTTSGSASATGATDGSSMTTGISTNAEAIRGASVTFTGVGSTTAESTSGSATSAYDTSVSVGGNAPADGESITVTGGTNGLLDSSPSGTASDLKTSATLGTVTEITVTVADTESDDYGEAVEVRIHNGDTSRAVINDITYADGSSTWTTSVNMAPGSKFRVSIHPDTEMSGTDSAADIDLTHAEATVSASAPDATVDGTTYDFGTVATGATATRTIDGFTAGSNTIDWGGVGSFDYNVEWGAVTASDSPGLDLDGDGTTDVSHSGVLMSGETATVAIPDAEISPSTSSVVTTLSSGSVDSTVDYQRVDYSENPTLVASDGTTLASHSGILAPGETVETTLDTNPLTTSTTGLDVETAGGTTVATTASFKEWSGTGDRIELFVNGNSAVHAGTLADGEKTTLDVEESWLQEGTNTVSVELDSTSTDAPPRAVKLDYSHVAKYGHNSTHEMTRWQETHEVSRQFDRGYQNPTLSVRMSPSTVAIESVASKRGDGTFTSMDSSAYAYDVDNGTLDISLASVAKNEVVSVRVNGRAISTQGGSVEIVEATGTGQSLDTLIRVEERTAGLQLVTPTSRILHVSNPSYDGADASSIIDSSRQTLTLPNAPAGSTLTLTTVPATVEPTSTFGDIEVHVEEAGSYPQLRISPGPSGSGHEASITLHRAATGDVVLRSVTSSATLAREEARNGKLTVTISDSDDVINFIKQSGAGVPVSTGGLPTPLIILLAMASLLGLTVGVRRWGGGLDRRGGGIVAAGTLVTTVLGVEGLAPGTIRTLAFSPTVADPLTIAGSGLALVAMWWGVNKLGFPRRLRIAAMGVGSIAVGMLAIETLAPGSLSTAIAGAVGDSIQPAIRLGSVIFVVLAGYAVYRVVTGRGIGRSDSSSSDSSNSSSGSDDGDRDITITTVAPDSISRSSGGDDS